MRLACKKPSLPQKPEQSWRVLRFFGPNTEPSDVIGVPLDGCYASPGPRGADAENPRLAASLSQKHRCLAPFIDLKPLIGCRTPPTVALLRRRNNQHRFALLTSKMVRSPLPLLALAALSAAFVPQTQTRLAARIRADEIEAAEDAADAEPRTAPEVNSGAERCMNQTVATRPRHRRDACSIA